MRARTLQRDGLRREVVDALVLQGWRVDVTNGGHLRCVPPDPARAIVITGSTPSDHRATKHWITQLRLSGFRWRGQRGRHP